MSQSALHHSKHGTKVQLVQQKTTKAYHTAGWVQRDPIGRVELLPRNLANRNAMCLHLTLGRTFSRVVRGRGTSETYAELILLQLQT